jgi:hypothetical protein
LDFVQGDEMIEWLKLPRLVDLYERYRFDSKKLAELAGVDERAVILPMFRMDPVEREDAIKVLAALSVMVNGDYSLETVRVVLAR